MTKADASKGSDAMGHMIRRGTLTLSDAESEKAHLLAGGEKEPLLGYIPMDGDVDEELITPPIRQPDFEGGAQSDTVEQVAMAGIAALLQEQLRLQLSPVTSAVDNMQKEIARMDGNLTGLNTTLSETLDTLEKHMNLTDARVEKLEHLCEEIGGSTILSNDALEAKIRECIQEYMAKQPHQTQVHAAWSTHLGKEGTYTDKRMVAAVTGNLDGLSDLVAATTWLQDKMELFHNALGEQEGLHFHAAASQLPATPEEGVDLAPLMQCLCSEKLVFEKDETWDHELIFQEVASAMNSDAAKDEEGETEEDNKIGNVNTGA
ncbi:unnamed protein product [Prorocentrum cordatum]|uniref:Uncharacterized protein n=1 Tax=Prorocentrum cordatum TaxID=2364126 RepID=A0ABN9S6B9_9DINO|nr:unnamed protein product [Polarella glacialis]